MTRKWLEFVSIDSFKVILNWNRFQMLPGDCMQSLDIPSLHLQAISPVSWFAVQNDRLSTFSHVEL